MSHVMIDVIEWQKGEKENSLISDGMGQPQASCNRECSVPSNAEHSAENTMKFPYNATHMSSNLVSSRTSSLVLLANISVVIGLIATITLMSRELHQMGASTIARGGMSYLIVHSVADPNPKAPVRTVNPSQ